MSETAEPDPAHAPVMVEEVVDLLRSVPPGGVVDATVGLGGHARAVLAATDHLRLVGIDQDADALAAAATALAGFEERVTLLRARFDDLNTVLTERALRGGVSAVLFDLGVSSPQLDRADRGFSYRAV